MQDQVSKMLEDLLKELHEIVQRKTSILKSDEQEVKRQRQELELVEQFLKQESAESSPIEFLQISVGYALLKDQILNQNLKISGDLQDDKEMIKVALVGHGPVVSYNDDLKNKTFDYTQTSNKILKVVAEKTKGNIEQSLKTDKFSSHFRRALFQSKNVFNIDKRNSNDYSQDIPDVEHPKNFQTQNLVEKMFKIVEKKLQ